MNRSEEICPRVRANLQTCRDRLVSLLRSIPGIVVADSQGAMYCWFKIDRVGMEDSLHVCLRLVHEARLGLAPGTAFGPEGRGWFRWCFATKDISRLELGVDRLRKWLEEQ
jgi:aspartate/methionine/tyrosine aminotransferase